MLKELTCYKSSSIFTFYTCLPVGMDYCSTFYISFKGGKYI